MVESRWDPLSTKQVALLDRDRFESLCFLLLTREFGTDLRRIEDRLGSGNGLDAAIVTDDVIGFQIRCYDPQNAHRFGGNQKTGVVDSVRKAKVWSDSLKKKLSQFTLVCNIDLQPKEFAQVLEWFAEVEERFNLTTDVRPLLWVYDALLRAPRTNREEFFGPSPVDIGEKLSHLSAVQMEQGKILLAVKEQLAQFARINPTEGLAVERLIKEAQTHYLRAKEKHDQLAYKDATERAYDAQRLLAEHWEDKPLFADITYLVAICLSGIGDWGKAALEFDRAKTLYERTGDNINALFARGNAARMRSDISNDDSELPTFLELYEIWDLEGSLHNILASILNIGNCYKATDRESLAITWYSKGLQLIEEAKFRLNAIESLDYIPAFLQLWGSLGMAAQQMGDFEGAREAFDAVDKSILAGHRLGEVREIQFIRGQNLINRSNLNIKEKRWKDAVADALIAEKLFRQFQVSRAHGTAVYNLGEALLELGDLAGADSAFESAAKSFEEVNALSDEADALIGRSEVHLKLGSIEEAKAFVIRAQKLRNN